MSIKLVIVESPAKARTLARFLGKDYRVEASIGAEGVRWFFLWRMLLRFAVPAFLIFVLYRSVPGTLQAVAGLFR